MLSFFRKRSKMDSKMLNFIINYKFNSEKEK
jgi:hypothetical protein